MKDGRRYPIKVSVRVLCLSEEAVDAAMAAADLLNRAQRVFCFQVELGPDLELRKEERFHQWETIESTLARPEIRQQADFVFGILDAPIENNWFSHASWGRGIGFISTHSWEFISSLPVASFVAYELVENLVELLWIADDAEGQRFLAEIVHHGEGRGCLHDMCEFKPRIGIKIRTGDICPDCLNLMESRLKANELKAVQRMLDTVRLFALGRSPRGKRSESRSVAPTLNEGGWDRYEPLAIKTMPSASPPPAEDVLEARLAADEGDQPPVVHSAMLLPDIACCVSGPRRSTICSPGEVDQQYPFPVAHCFRAMRVEFTGTRKFKTLLQLYAVVTKYLTLVLLANRVPAQGANENETKDLLRNLKFGGLGQWGKACFRLLREQLDSSAPGFLDHLVENSVTEEVGVCENISKDFVRLRNETEGHGFVQSEEVYERLFLQQLEPVQRMLSLMRPLAEYTLCRVAQVKSHRAGKCVYDARILRGSNPLFEVERRESASLPESDCLLRHPWRDEHVNLWPWILLEDCPQCMRQMVFLYDHLEHVQAVFREYPNNHCKHNGELVAEIGRRIG